MKESYVRSFGTDRNGNSTFEWTENQISAGLYDEVQAHIDCELLNRFSPGTVTPKAGGERLLFENFRLLKVTERLYCMAFESRTEAERIVYAPGLGRDSGYERES